MSIARQYREGKRIDHTPAAAVPAGRIVLVNPSTNVHVIKGVAFQDIAANELGALDAEYGRIFEFPNPNLAGSEIKDGTPIHVNFSNASITTAVNSGGGSPVAYPRFGQCVGDTPGTSATILVRAMFALLIMFCLAARSEAQTVCIDGKCYPTTTGINLQPIAQSDLDCLSKPPVAELQQATTESDRLNLVTRATVRVTVQGVCGSGTIVGFDAAGQALILTNAHVAGTQRGRVVNVERWDTNGRSERGTAAIISSGYGRGLSVDFAVLRAVGSFGKGVTPIPIANRQPDTSSPITTYGCPRCEWPSLQTLRMIRADGQILRWAPEAIGGRSGSSVVDHTSAGPRVVGLLTWGGNGEGLGQSAPFLLSAMKGQLPKSIESLPEGVAEVDTREKLVRAAWPPQPIPDDEIIGTITEPKPNAPKPTEPIVAPSTPGTTAPVDTTRAAFRKALLAAGEKAFAEKQITRLDLLRLRVATLSPKMLERMQLVVAEQVVAEGKALVEVDANGIAKVAWDWSKLIGFLQELMPIVLDLIELINRQRD